MREVYCAACNRVHSVQAWDEWTAPRRETLGDWIKAFVTWAVCLGALVTFYFWAWSVVA